MGGLAAVLRYALHDLEELAAAQPRLPSQQERGAAAGAGQAGEEEASADGGARDAARAYDSDASSDSDASYKIGARGKG